MTTAEVTTTGATGESKNTTETHEAAPHDQPPQGPHGYSKQKDQHLKRLRRIEGQIRGLQRMVEEDVYCIDILTQVSAGTKALQSFALQLLEEHLRHCVATAANSGSADGTAQAGQELDEKVAEATAAIARLLRT
ncbi:metal-sensitive transcriptional regulator [Actinacidiphila oryziradicis]|uniref:Metal-sensitive transcriptional regulator n=1 Tax=Actinacidiphila oryziradicis TaxID=2571141 RepID=A0A4U0T6L2_9ACTN|nr:metal-sensitive transcriptional regulator [Actinacidiphila oryziradicis]TKA08435.1 metal-sensitive transcriptional regulator [Actinacidiphila oryziradicis]